MSGIISAEPFNTVFPETKDGSTMQGLVTAIYEVGMLLHLPGIHFPVLKRIVR